MDAGAKARTRFAALPARLKSCPVTKPDSTSVSSAIRLPIDLPIDLPGELPGNLPIQVCYLNEISAGIVKHCDGRSRSLGWLLGERHSVFLQPLVLLLYVADEEISSASPLPENLLLIRFRGRVFVELQNQL